MDFIKIKLSECCQIRPPKSEAKKALMDSDLVSFVPMKNLGIDSKNLILDTVRKLSEVSGSYTYFTENDVLLAKITPCFENGKLGIATGLKNRVGFGSSEFVVFRPNEDLLSEYLYYFLLQPSFRDNGKKVMTGAVGHKRVSKDFIANTKIPLPTTVNEQKRIVTILGKAFANIEKARANAEKNIKNSRELFESYLQQVFSHHSHELREVCLADVCKINSKLIDPREKEYIELPHVGAGNIVSNTGEIINIKTAKEEGLISGKFVFDGSMVLYSKIRPYLKKVCRPRFSGLCSADIYPLSPISKKIDENYLFYLLLSRDFTGYAISGSERAGMPKVNRTHLFKYNFFLPDIKQQKKDIKLLDKVFVNTQALEGTYTKKLKSLDELKKSILQKAFTGELTKAK